MATYIAPISWGMGDLAVSLPVVQSLIDSGVETHLIIRSNLQSGLAKRIEGLASVILEEDFDSALLSPSDRYINLRDHPLQKNFWWGSPEFSAAYPGYKINDCLSAITEDFGLAVDFNKLSKLRFERCPDASGAVIFIAGTDGSYKYWPTENWLRLYELLKAQAKRVVLLGEPDQCPAVNALCHQGVPWIKTVDLGDAIDLISCAEAIVGVDTGLTHIAINQGVKTIVLYRPDPIYIRHYDHVTAFIAKDCAPECLEASFSCSNNTILEFKGWQPKTWSCLLGTSQGCMSSIDPRAVFAACLAHSETSKV